MRLPLYVASLRFRIHVCVSCTCFFCVVGSLVCDCMFVLCVIVYAFAVVCCAFAFHITFV